MPKPEGTYPLLSRIESPADLRQLPAAKLPELAAELREFLIQSVSTRGGHFAAGLGTVELTIALHYVYDTPRDLLVWDVGHQAYPHKVLTGRRDRLHTIKQRDGLAPSRPRRKASTTPSPWGTRALRSAQPWVWPLRPPTRAAIGVPSPSSAMAR